MGQINLLISEKLSLEPNLDLIEKIEIRGQTQKLRDQFESLKNNLPINSSLQKSVKVVVIL